MADDTTNSRRRWIFGLLALAVMILLTSVIMFRPRTPWLQVHLPEMDANHDGRLSRDELLAEVDQTFSGYDKDADGQVTLEERNSANVRSAAGGFFKQHAREIDSNADDVITRPEMCAALSAMFDRGDRNYDDIIEPAEWNGR